MTNHKYNASWIFRWPLALLLALGVWLCVQPLTAWACGGGIICVDADATGAATGLSWTDAYTNVQDALAVATPGDEIWVAEGVYYPDEGGGQTSNALTATFTLTNEVALYGGFAATETLLTQRDWTAHVTVLSGDIDGNDWNTDTNHIAETWNDLRGSNAYHVVTGGGVTQTARLDGFTVTAGYANDASFLHRCGGGMLNYDSSPTLTHVTFSGNRANFTGGGMDNEASSPTLTHVTFSGNQATNAGGGMYNNYSSPTLVNCILWGDNATHDPEIYNDGSSITMTYSTIQDWSGGGTGNLARDPQFVAPVAASSAPTTTGNYRLREDSPAIDAGAPATCPPDDLDGQPRADLRCDMGAYERQYRDGDTVIQRDFTGGTPYSFGPTWVSMTLTAADTGSITVTKHRTPPGGVWDAGEISVTWWISSSLSAGFPVTLSLCYTDAEVADLDESRLAMFRWNGSAWVDQNATPDPAHHCVTLSGVTGFSAWTLKDVSVGAATPTAARVVGVAAWGFAPVAAFLVLGGALALRYRRRP